MYIPEIQLLDMQTVVGLLTLGIDPHDIDPTTDLAYDRKFGSNPAVGTSFEDIWEAGGAMYWPGAAQTLDTVSADGNDTNTAGSGARKQYLAGLDGSFDALAETVNLNGVTPVTTSGSFFRLNRSYITEVGGSYPTSALAAAGSGSNAGNITITRTTGGETMGLIGAGQSQTQLLRYTVENGKGALIRSTRMFIDSSKAVDIQGKIRLSVDATSAPFAPWRIILNWPGLAAPTGAKADFAVAFPAKTDIALQADTTSGSTSVVSGVLDILNVEVPA